MSAEYSFALRIQTEIKRRMPEFFEYYDLLSLPSTTVAAPPIKDKDAIEQAKLLPRFTTLFNLTGLPAPSINHGYTQGNFPIDLQIVGAAWGEKNVFTNRVCLRKSND